ncbi:MAG: translocation/assembly module TamB, partial [Spirochaetales bacterium]|nr:translocation/assembly module TamB [Spirochaetales bacterium]
LRTPLAFGQSLVFGGSYDLFLYQDEFRLFSPESRITDSNNRNNQTVFRLRSDTEEMKITDVKINWGDYRAKGNLITEFGDQELRFSSDFSLQDRPYQLQGALSLSREVLVLSGSYGIDLSARFHTPEPNRTPEIVFALHGSNIPIPLGDRESLVTMDINGMYGGVDSWEVVFREFSITDLPVPGTGGNRLSLAGRINSESGRIYRVRYADEYSSISGKGQISRNANRKSGSGFSYSGWLQLSGSGGEEQYHFSGDYESGTVSGRLAFRGAPVRRWGIQNLGGSISGSASVFYEGKKDYLIEAGIDSDQLLFNEEPLSVSSSVNIDPSGGQFEDTNILYRNNHFTNSRGSVDLNTGLFRLESSYSGRFQDLDVNMKIIADGSYVRTPLEYSDLISVPFETKLTMNSIEVGEEPKSPWNMYITRGETFLSVNGGPEYSVSGRFDNDGTFFLDLSNPLPIRLSMNGNIEGGEIEADIRSFELELNSAGRIFQKDYFRADSGTLTGNIRIQGPINDPAYNGRLMLNNAVIGSRPLPSPTDPINATLYLSGRSWRIPQTRATINDRAIEFSLNFQVDHWLPRNFSFSMETQDPDGIKVDDKYGRLAFEAFILGSLSVYGDTTETNVEGNIKVPKASVFLEERRIRKDFNQEVTADFTITTGQEVTFFWPSQELPIIRAYTDSNQTVDIRYSSVDSMYSVIGNVDLRGGEIYYLNRNFFMKEGRISFNEEQEVGEKIDPTISARAQLREFTPEGAVDIYLIANEERFSRFSPRFTSDPPLPDSQIIALLGKGLFGGQEEAALNISTALALTSNFLGQFSIVRSFENSVREVLGLDQFSFRTQLLGAVISEQIAPGPTNELGEYANPYTRYLDNTSLFLGKYLGEDIFLQMLIRFQSLNEEAVTGYAYDDFRVDAEINLEWETPFVLLTWSLEPEHPEDLFLSDTSIELSWSFSY